ncbi:HTH domain-containing protein [Helicobacter pylori]|uniref:HTH domain-containing protein n=1 Tax=Helicobacter pylori TaxID=210 RepID=UPI001FD03D6F|nr:HTH domain-containing protein [Helicobacter pylori]UOR48988.1 HTH domain-containing protein [Helicobacter pylori]
MTYIELGKKVLEQAERPLKPKEIWERACEMGLDKERPSIGKTPWSTIGSELGKDKKQFYVARKEKGKRQETYFYWLKSREREFPPQETLNTKEKDNGQSECLDAAKKQETSFNERDLHPLLVKFLSEDPKFRLLCKTIYHERCLKDKRGKCEWNYPDIVGVYFPYNKYSPFDKYDGEILKFLHHTGQKKHKLFSFELKVNLKFTNLKESYFQAVSNSSWANEGYLVVKNIDDEVLGELRRLNQSFGIGVIKLESDISNSKILLPAREKEIDIPTLNMLVEQSLLDFKPFMIDINTQIEKGLDTPIEMKSFDKVFNDEEMQKYIKDKGIEDKGIQAE